MGPPRAGGRHHHGVSGGRRLHLDENQQHHSTTRIQYLRGPRGDESRSGRCDHRYSVERFHQERHDPDPHRPPGTAASGRHRCASHQGQHDIRLRPVHDQRRRHGHLEHIGSIPLRVPAGERRRRDHCPRFRTRRREQLVEGGRDGARNAGRRLAPRGCLGERRQWVHVPAQNRPDWLDRQQHRIQRRGTRLGPSGSDGL